MMQLRSFIANQWVESARAHRFQSLNPATNEPIADVMQASAEDVDAAVGAAKKAFDCGSWSELDPDSRAEILLRAAAIMRRRLRELAEWEARDVGKPLREAELIDIPYSIRALEYFANQAREIQGQVIPLPGQNAFDWVSYEPYGVVAGIIPWNFPLHLATRCVAPALATGNTVVLKPSPLAPVTPTLLGDIFREAGLPPGVFNVVNGGADVGERLVSHADVRMVSFTGSVPTGRRVMELSARSRIIKKLLLEMGGKGPFIVEPDCDINGAVNSLIVGFCLVAGQVCCASTRLYLHERIYDDFMSRLLKRVQSLRFGDLMDPATQMSAIISSAQLQKVEAYVNEARENGATVRCGGARHTKPPFDRGNFYPPTILENVSPDMRCHREEIFGPVLVVLPYQNLDDAIALANDSSYALGATVWTENIRRLYHASRHLDAGIVWLNTNVMSKIEAPYGGNKNSGLGREDGVIGLKEYLKVKNNVLFVGKDYDNFYGFSQ
ncbi:MAG: aldehyde dehydrogenase [Pedosphaera sp.]|nr:aldehyde dehydrogenase [Pedosphaera sp.]